jgi:hypothetical protein
MWVFGGNAELLTASREPIQGRPRAHLGYELGYVLEVFGVHVPEQRLKERIAGDLLIEARNSSVCAGGQCLLLGSIPKLCWATAFTARRWLFSCRQ